MSERPQDTVALPPRMAKLARDKRGYPIPYSTLILPDGTPDFAAANEPIRLKCIFDHLCPICGDKLDYWVYFIGGPKSHESRVFFDPGMHEECARYSAAVCPFIRNEGMRYRKVTPAQTADGIVHVRHPTESDVRPDKMGIFVTRKYEAVRSKAGLYIKASPWKNVEWIVAEGKVVLGMQMDGVTPIDHAEVLRQVRRSRT
jgi:hypothetical protein